MLFHNFGFIKCILAVCQLITILLEKCKYNLSLGGHMTYALGSSGTMSMAMSSLSFVVVIAPNYYNKDVLVLEYPEYFVQSYKTGIGLIW